WGGSFVLIKIAAAEIPALTLVFLRVGLAALALNAVALATGRRYPAGSTLGGYAVMGFLNSVLPFVLIVHATMRIGAGSASILNATTPIFTLIVAHLATRDEKMTGAKLAGVLLGAGGVAAMTDPAAVL